MDREFGSVTHSVWLMPISGPGSGSVDFTDDLRLAHVLADDADSITENRFKALDLHVMSKPDLTPVTDADQAVEEAIRRTLSRVRSRDAVLGEEQGSTGHSQRQWVIDPIDGTKNFVRGVPVWATLIALVVDERGGARRGVGPRAAASLVGVEGRRRVDRPLAAQGDALHRVRRTPPRGRLAVLLLPARLGGARTARGLPLADASLLAHPRLQRLLVLHAARRGRRRHRRPSRSSQVYDMAALDVIVREAGGRFSSLDGTDGPFGGNALATNGHLHEAVLAFLGSLPDGHDDPEFPPLGPGSVSDLRSRRARVSDPRPTSRRATTVECLPLS